MLRQKYQFKNYNWTLVAAVLILCALSVVFINSADSSYTSRQFLGILFCTAVMFFLSLINYNFICDYSRIFYIVNLILLLLVEFVGSSAGGAKRWLNLGFTRIQPSELTKIFMIIVVAVYIQEHEEDFNEWKNLVKLAVLCAVPIILVLIEPNLSTTIDITVILLAVIFVGGLNMKTGPPVHYYRCPAFCVVYLVYPDAKSDSAAAVPGNKDHDISESFGVCGHDRLPAAEFRDGHRFRTALWKRIE